MVARGVQEWRGMPPLLRGLLWFAAYLALVLAPGIIAAAADPIGFPRSWFVELSVAIGFVAFAVIAAQFALVSRIQASSRPFGTDALVQLHQYLGGLTLVLAVAHPLLLHPGGLPFAAWIPGAGGLVATSGSLAFWALVALVLTTVRRNAFGLSYEWWRRCHLSFAALVGIAMVAHVLAVDGYSSAWPVRATVFGYAAAFGLVTVYYRWLRPLLLARRPWELVANQDAGGSTRLLRLRPLEHAGFAFEPGQFAWLITGRTALSGQQHPLSIASSAERSADGWLEFSVKALGDWSSTVVPALASGTRVWVDGPFGAFTTERKAAQGFVMIAGGIGIAPMRSMLLTMRDRGDRRHVVLFIAANDETRLVFRSELDGWRAALALDVVVVLEAPSPQWTGARGRISADLLRQQLPPQFRRYHYFVCGPPAMMDVMERMLLELGVAPSSIDSERFNLV
jgi:predicted ferric reductase